MTGIDRINKQIYETEHDPKNKEALPIAIFFSVICIIFKNPLFWESLVWGIYYLYCDSNNKKWSNLPSNIKKREFLIGFRNDVLSGKIKLKEDE